MLVPAVMAAVCLCAGAAGAERLRARAALLRSWQRALFAMHAACAYARATCAQVLRAGASEVCQLGEIARAVELNGADAGRLFAAGGKDRLLRDEEHAVLASALNAVATGGREEMSAALGYALERFQGFCSESEKKRNADAGLYLTLGALTGLCVFLVLC